MIATPKHIWFHITTSRIGPELIAKKTINGTAKQLKEIVFNINEKNDRVIKEAIELAGSKFIAGNENKKNSIKPIACSFRRITNKEQLKILPAFLNGVATTSELNEKSYTCTEVIATRTIVICHIAPNDTHLIEIDENVASQATTNFQLEQTAQYFQGNGHLSNLARGCLSLFIVKSHRKAPPTDHDNDLYEISLLAHHFFD